MSGADLPAIVVMGVSGSGKSTIGKLLAERLGADGSAQVDHGGAPVDYGSAHVDYVDTDDLHPASNVEKMHRGVPLTDADRAPWLQAVGEAIRDRVAAGHRVVMACSALRRAYREAIAEAAGTPVWFAYLDVPRGLLEERLNHRKGHFMPPSLLDSQLETLEPLEADEPGAAIDMTGTPDENVAEVLAALGRAEG